MGVPDDAGVIDEDIDSAEIVYRGTDDAFRLFFHGNAAIADHRGTTGGFYHLDDTVAGSGTAAPS